MRNKVVHIKATTKADPTSRESRIAMANMITRQFDLWQLDLHDQLSLLGLSRKSSATLMRYRSGAPIANSRDFLDRVAILLSIHKSLRSLFPKNRELCYRWPTIPNRVFGNRSPVEFILKEGFKGLLAVKQYLDMEKAR